MVAAREASCLSGIVGRAELKALVVAARKLQKLVETSRLQLLHYSDGFAHLDQFIAQFRNALGAFAMSGAPSQQSLANRKLHQCLPEPTAPLSDALLLSYWYGNYCYGSSPCMGSSFVGDGSDAALHLMLKRFPRCPVLLVLPNVFSLHLPEMILCTFLHVALSQ